jgi:hypothetical protein
MTKFGEKLIEAVKEARAIARGEKAPARIFIPADRASEMNVIKSVYDNDQEILLGIQQLHLNGKPFEVDPTYAKGMMYRDGVAEPRLKFDIAPQLPGVKRADCRRLPLANATVGSIICDLPHMFGFHGTNRPDNKVSRGYSTPQP